MKWAALAAVLALASIPVVEDVLWVRSDPALNYPWCGAIARNLLPREWQERYDVWWRRTPLESAWREETWRTMRKMTWTGLWLCAGAWWLGLTNRRTQ
jgi:hypothetical protein